MRAPPRRASSRSSFSARMAPRSERHRGSHRLGCRSISSPPSRLSRVLQSAGTNPWTRIISLMQGAELILTLAGGLGAALVLGYFTQRLGLSPIVGYLMAGVLVGPHTPGFAANAELAEQLAEVGVILIMFGGGLQLHLDELLAVRRAAIPGAIAGMVSATALGAFAAHAFGWPWPAAIVFGLTLSVASTVVLVRVLSDARALHTPSGHIAVGWLVMEDILTVITLVLLPTLVSGELTVG